MDSSTPLNHKASQETLISLLQLDPSPIDSPSTDKELPPLPEEEVEASTDTLRSHPTSSTSHTPASPSAIGLSGGGLTRVQRYSSYTFTLFAGLHMANTSLIPLIYQSVPYSEPFLLMTREIYQTRISEPLLIGLPIAAHILSGLSLRLIRRHQNLKRYGGETPGMYALHRANTSKTSSSVASGGSRSALRMWPPLSYVSISGYVLIVPLAAHVFINRVLPLVVEGDSSNIGLQYVAHGFARHGIQPWIAYALLLSVGAGHMVWGWATWLGVAPPTAWKKTTIDKQLRRRRRRAWWGITGLAALVAGVWAAGGLGVVARAGPADGWIGTVYDGIYKHAGQ
ncbi:uncharacterized protein JN550_012113 [Neoarthrinium moseri]|uniref:uncharacterized protein n=1 Tax=Neoarthrinium moseri TaxID=1658444 RepID=UPI001FDE9EAA|nr:uncharacterized protein JN550_012113 [Neoarthrinium moseri]KAI1859304.1 hypothetical protein JN550_012113 [Neoarthrinium moseri]